MSDGSITGCTLAGLIADQAAVVSLDAVEISGTLALGDGTSGRGVQLQYRTTSTLDGLVLDDNADAAVFGLAPLSVTASGLAVSDTAAGMVPDDGSSTGDGIVVTRGSYTASASNFNAAISDTVIDGSARAAIVLSGVTGSLADNTVTNSGYELEGSAVLCQDSAVASGDACVDVEGAGVDPLSLYDVELSTAGPG